MTEPILTAFEERLRESARSLPYPATPNIAAAVHRKLVGAVPRRSSPRRWAWALAVVFVIGAGLLLAPGVRAAVLDFISIGVIRIFRSAPTAVPTAPATPQLSAAPAPAVTPTPTPLYLASVLSLSGETTLEAARERVDFPIRMPTEPPDLGEPDYVFLQEMGGPMLVLVWVAPGQPEQVEMSLHMFGPDSFAGQKVEPRVLEETQVNGKTAAWTEGPYLLRLIHDDLQLSRLVDGNVLIWEQDGITYRLESRLTLEEARRVAESLK